jgi:hypothetical protein
LIKSKVFYVSSIIVVIGVIVALFIKIDKNEIAKGHVDLE